MSNYIEHAWREFRAAGWVDDQTPPQFIDDSQKAICNGVLDLLRVLSEQGHSGTTAPYAIELFQTLAQRKPLCPLTGEDSEWVDVSNYSGYPHWQNKRCTQVFKDDTGVYDVEGKVFWDWDEPDTAEFVGPTNNTKFYYTNSESRTYVAFPYTPHTEYIYRERAK